MAIGTDVGSAFQAGSSISAQDLRAVITTLAIAAVLLFAAWHMVKVFTRGWRKADLPHILTGVVLILVLVFFVFWVAGRFGTTG